MSNYKLLTVLYFILQSPSIYLHAQVNFTAPNQEYYATIDRLMNDLKSVQDTNRVKVLTNLCWTYKDTNPLKALEYGEKALQLAQKLSYKSGIANAYNYLGVVYNTQGNYLKSQGSHLLSAQAFKKIRDKIGVSQAYQRAGITPRKNHEFQKALEYYQLSLKVARQIKDPFRIASPLSNMGGVYQSLGDYKKALTYYQNALTIYKTLADSAMIGITLNNIGKTYENQNATQLAQEYYLEAKNIAEQSKDSSRLAQISLNLAQIHYKNGEIPKAEQLALQSLKLSRKYLLRPTIQESSYMLAQMYAQGGQFQQAFTYQLIYTQMLDSLHNEEESRRITEIQELVETEQKKANSALLQKDNIIKAEGQQLTKSYIYLAWVIAGFMVLLAFFLYRSNLYRKQHNIELQIQNEKINRQISEIHRTKENIEKSKIELLEKNQLIEKKNESFRRILNQLNENNIRLTNSIRYAEKIQRAFLPHDNQFRDLFENHFIIFKPKDVVSGDFYWLNRVENKIFIAVVDCTGHGVPGAFMSMIGNTLLNEIINQEKVFQPNEVLVQLHEGIRWTLKQNDSKNTDGMDLSFCCIEQDDQGAFQVQFSGAKSSIYYYHQKELHFLKGDRKSIGGWQMEVKREFQNHYFTLQKGDILYFATDGYTDAPNPQRKKLGYKKFQQILSDNAQLSLKQQGAALLEALYAHKTTGEQRDDITIVGVQL